MNDKKRKINKWAVVGIVIGGLILFTFTIFGLIIKSLRDNFDAKNQFSSAKIKMQIVDRYNSNLYNNRCGTNNTIDYNHEFTEEELNCFTDLIFLDVDVTTEDINKFKNLQKLHISNAKLNHELELSINTELQELTIMYSELLTLNFNQIPNVKKIHLSNTIIKDNKLTINETKLESLEMIRTNIDEIVLSNNSSLEEIDIHDSEINKLIFDNNRKIEMDELEYTNRLQTAEYYNDPTPSSGIAKMKISKVKNIEFKNYNDIRRLLFVSNIKFNSLTFDGKRVYLENNEFIDLHDNILYDYSDIADKYLKLENLTIDKTGLWTRIKENDEIIFTLI